MPPPPSSVNHAYNSTTGSWSSVDSSRASEGMSLSTRKRARSAVDRQQELGHSRRRFKADVEENVNNVSVQVRRGKSTSTFKRFREETSNYSVSTSSYGLAGESVTEDLLRQNDLVCTDREEAGQESEVIHQVKVIRRPSSSSWSRTVLHPVYETGSSSGSSLSLDIPGQVHTPKVRKNRSPSQFKRFSPNQVVTFCVRSTRRR
jgi:hypothetical protein